LGLLAEKNKILAEKAAKESGPKGLTLTTKDATTQIQEYAKSQGVDIDDATAQAAGTQLQYVAKNNPQALALDPDGTLKTIMEGYKSKTPEWGFGAFGGDKAYRLPGLIQGQ
jgi:glycyl-tRNA synthetase beta subunit